MCVCVRVFVNESPLPCINVQSLQIRNTSIGGNIIIAINDNGKPSARLFVSWSSVLHNYTHTHTHTRTYLLHTYVSVHTIIVLDLLSRNIQDSDGMNVWHVLVEHLREGRLPVFYA